MASGFDGSAGNGFCSGHGSADAATPLVEASGVMKEYDGETVLAKCSFALHEGETVALIGASGEGKSTLLSILGLLLMPSAGRILVGGADAASLSDGEAAKLRAREFGFVFQHTQLVGSLRAIDNVLVPACFGRTDRSDVRQRVDELVERLGIANRINHYPHQLSVGQKRRVALVRALALSPRILIADEPTNDLDEATALIVEEVLLGFAGEKHAAVYATHDLALARRASRVLRLADGRLEELTPDEVKEAGGTC